MKIRAVPCIILLSTVLTVIIAGGSKKNISTEETMGALFGTWVNTEYDTSRHRGGRLTISLDGTIAQYKRTTSEWPGYQGHFIIDEAWKDDEGNIMCTLTVTDFTQPLSYWLVKISNLGKTFESVYSHTGSDEFPKEIDPNDGWYIIYHRQE